MTNKDQIFTFENKIKYFPDLPTLISFSTLPETNIYFILALPYSAMLLYGNVYTLNKSSK